MLPIFLLLSSVLLQFCFWMYFVEGVSNSEAFDGFGVWKILFKNFVHGFEIRNFKNYILLVCILLQTRKFSCDLPFLFVL